MAVVLQGNEEHAIRHSLGVRGGIERAARIVIDQLSGNIAIRNPFHRFNAHIR